MKFVSLATAVLTGFLTMSCGSSDDDDSTNVDPSARSQSLQDEDRTARNADAEERTEESGNLAEELAADSRFTTLVKLLSDTGLAEAVAGLEAATVFAPTNEAFAKIPEATLEQVLADSELLKSILLYHVIGKTLVAQDVLAMGGQAIETLNGKGVTPNLVDGAAFINQSKIIETDRAASNGVIHVIDSVLIP